jgi:hypothetical protein
MAVTREEASPLVAEADELYRDALRQVADELGTEHPRALALKVALACSVRIPPPGDTCAAPDTPEFSPCH